MLDGDLPAAATTVLHTNKFCPCWKSQQDLSAVKLQEAWRYSDYDIQAPVSFSETFDFEKLLLLFFWDSSVGVHLLLLRNHYNNRGIKNQVDATYYFIVLLIGATCFGHYYPHQQELATTMLITILVV